MDIADCPHREWTAVRARPGGGLQHQRGCELCGALTYSNGGEAPPLSQWAEQQRRVRVLPGHYESDGTWIEQGPVLGPVFTHERTGADLEHQQQRLADLNIALERCRQRCALLERERDDLVRLIDQLLAQ